jgi:hypothetical protein
MGICFQNGRSVLVYLCGGFGKRLVFGGTVLHCKLRLSLF